jgi:hypothetical protein
MNGFAFGGSGLETAVAAAVAALIAAVAVPGVWRRPPVRRALGVAALAAALSYAPPAAGRTAALRAPCCGPATTAKGHGLPFRQEAWRSSTAAAGPAVGQGGSRPLQPPRWR